MPGPSHPSPPLRLPLPASGTAQAACRRFNSCPACPSHPQVTKRADGSNGCDYGVFAATVAYDKWVGRYMIAAICDDTQFPRVLLAVSTSDSVTDYWNLYSAPAENEVTGKDRGRRGSRAGGPACGQAGAGRAGLG
jgi:hypothetical protein